MWLGSFPRPTPDSKKSSITDLKNRFKMPVTVASIAIGSVNKSIDICDKYAVIDSIIYDITNPSYPKSVGNANYGAECTTNDKYVVGMSSNATTLYSQPMVNGVPQTGKAFTITSSYFNTLRNDGTDLFGIYRDGSNRPTVFKAPIDLNISTVTWSYTLSYSVDMLSTMVEKNSKPYIYVLAVDTTNKYVDLLMFDKATGGLVSSIALSRGYYGVQGAWLIGIDPVNGDIYVSISQKWSSSSSMSYSIARIKSDLSSIVLTKEITTSLSDNFLGGFVSSDDTFSVYVQTILYVLKKSDFSIVNSFQSPGLAPVNNAAVKWGLDNKKCMYSTTFPSSGYYTSNIAYVL